MGPRRIPPLIRDLNFDLVQLEYDLADALESGDPLRIAHAQGIRDKAVAHDLKQWAEPEPEPEAG
jgi:hypothetical protein